MLAWFSLWKPIFQEEISCQSPNLSFSLAKFQVWSEYHNWEGPGRGWTRNLPPGSPQAGSSEVEPNLSIWLVIRTGYLIRQLKTFINTPAQYPRGLKHHNLTSGQDHFLLCSRVPPLTRSFLPHREFSEPTNEKILSPRKGVFHYLEKTITVCWASRLLMPSWVCNWMDNFSLVRAMCHLYLHGDSGWR